MERERNPAFDALAESAGYNLKEIGAQGGEVAKALSLIRKVCEMPPPELAKEIRRRWAIMMKILPPGSNPGPMAMAKNWPRCGVEPKVASNGNGNGIPRRVTVEAEAATRARILNLQRLRNQSYDPESIARWDQKIAELEAQLTSSRS